MTEELKNYFDGDILAAQVWLDKYADVGEKTPEDMHRRMAKEFARIEYNYKNSTQRDGIVTTNKISDNLSTFGQFYLKKRLNQSLAEIEEDIFKLLDRFKHIVPQGSIMSVLGTDTIGSLSNCYVVPNPYDSYGGILKTDEHLVQLMKRRAGVGTCLDSLRPGGAFVNNVAKTSTGADSFMPRYSDTTREVAQGGRRGALMLLMSCNHPSIFKFVTKKKDRTQVTGANVSVMFTNKFMEAVKADEDFYCSFPVDMILNIEDVNTYNFEYNKLENYRSGYIMKIKAKELWELVIEMAWENAEPGIAYKDRVISYSPESVYELFVPIACNPCGEQWLNAYDSCRLFAMNLFNIVKNHFQTDSKIDFDLLYEIAYIQQVLADNLIDLELERIDAILAKLDTGPEPLDIKQREIDLWTNVRKVCKAGRRTGCGITALGDMLAALNLTYDGLTKEWHIYFDTPTDENLIIAKKSTENENQDTLKVIEKVMKTKMEAELDATIDLAILRGTFEGWNPNLEYTLDNEGKIFTCHNDFYNMLALEFPLQVERMIKYGRRNISWSTIAPTGTVSLMTQTSSGCEPLFKAFYIRRTKINPGEGKRVDFIDQNGDSWTEYPVLHPKFKDWYLYNQKIQAEKIEKEEPDRDIKWIPIEELTKEQIQISFEKSPWFGSQAEDIDWVKRVKIQAILQKYTTNAISSTINLPNTATKEQVAEIYMEAYEQGLKGVTVYRDGCRTGVLVSEPTTQIDEFGYINALKRPKEIDGELNVVSVKGDKYGVLVGLINNKPYEVFAFHAQGEDLPAKNSGKIIKVKKGQYDYISDGGTLSNIQHASIKTDEQVLTRLISGMLRHGTEPKYIIEQISKCDLEISSFGKSVSRVLKKYIAEGAKSTVSCEDCGSDEVIFEEGCRKCKNCGSSKCG